MLAVLAASTLALAGCSSDSSAASGTSAPVSSPSTSTPEVTGNATIFAAASLTEAFTALAKSFEASHPGTKLTMSFGASSTLNQNIVDGAPADAFASADEDWITKLVDAGHASGTPTVIARNQLTIVTEPGNPKHITSLADLANPDVSVVLCAAEVPCGRLAEEALAKANVSVTPKSREANVKSTLSKVELGEADAAIVYSTDAKGNSSVASVPIEQSQNVITKIPIVAVKGTRNRELVDAWIAYLIAAPQQRRLTGEFGFLLR